MDVIELLIENLGMFLAMAHYTMAFWIDMPVNATGPLDPNITLTSPGFNIVTEIAQTAVSLSRIVAETMELLF